MSCAQGRDPSEAKCIPWPKGTAPGTSCHRMSLILQHVTHPMQSARGPGAAIGELPAEHAQECRVLLLLQSSCHAGSPHCEPAVTTLLALF